MADFSDEFVSIAKRVLPSPQFERIEKRALAATGGRVYARKAVFVCGEPSLLEKLRGRALCGPAGVVFEKQYLAPLGLKRGDVEVLFKAHAVRAQEPGELWIALGQAAKEFAALVLPHPDVVRKQHSHEELTRKLAAVAEALCKKLQDGSSDEVVAANVKQLIAEGYPQDQAVAIAYRHAGKEQAKKAEQLSVSISKADATQHIVYGVVLDPYVPQSKAADGHADWVSPAEIEKTAHGYVKDKGSISLDHARDSKGSYFVESFVEDYPTPDDRKKAFAGEPHTIKQRKFGDDVINSGAWVLGVKLDDEAWAGYESGEYDAFSVEGLAERVAIDQTKMPEYKIAS